MLRLLGSQRRLCDGVSRRDLLHIGGLGLYGLTLDRAAQLAAATPPSNTPLSGFGRAKSCIMLFLFGAAPQHETFDPKPEAPAEIQGELRGISTSLPGVAFCEGLPQTARIADRLTVVRSMTHPFPLHCVAYALSGMPAYTTDLETKPRDPAQWPYVGSIADYLWERSPGITSEPGGVPRHIGLPWVFNSQVDDLGLLAGPYAAFLGQQFDPVWAKFEGKPLRVAPKCRHEQPKEYTDPYAAIDPDCRFVFDGAGQFQEQVTIDRFHLRRVLLEQLDTARRAADRAAAERSYTINQSRALSLLTAPKVREALDIGRESPQLRAQYGHTLFGQSCLAARRLVEAGSRFVSVFWDAYGTYFSGAWDTHQNHYPRLKQYLLPGFDAAFSALILDLEQRGLLDETLVLCLSEHGRTPQIDSKPVGAARHHWSEVYSMALAGGGTHRGAVVGRSDRIGGTVAQTPISPKDIHATTYHLLGLDPQAVVYDQQHRPYPVAGDGKVREELLA
uniref:DUF1501 domain-containing protein n=1 Tax=Schlesneria paludicola TaxID=360056 RepID=A0A7C2P9X0_9PLAN